MIQTHTEDFHVDWDDPADAQLHWNWDKMHGPRPVPPLAADVNTMTNAVVFKGRSVSINGYAYTTGIVFPTPTPEVNERGVHDVWWNDYVPLLREACERLRNPGYDSMSAADLAGALDDIIAKAGDAFLYTMVVAMAFGMPTNVMADFCEKELGPDGGQLAATMLQGFDNESAGAGAELGELARLAGGLPEVAKTLREGRYDELESADGGGEFLAGFRRFQEEYGWRVSNWGLLHVPTWAEDPRTPLALIRRYLSDPDLSPDSAIRRSAEQREQASQEIESRLSDEHLTKFRQLLEACQKHVSMSESRAFWQLTIDGSLRVPLVALGRKLVDRGVLDEPNDIFFLSFQEVKEHTRKPTSSMAATVAARKADLERWENLTPPAFVGAPPPESALPAAFTRAIARFWGYGIEASTEKNVIKGHAASRGVVRGRTRVLRDLSEADRLQKGEILVCRSTAPPWTPLFAISAGVVTDTGGILSHSAICAREYGIPCVAGTQTATQQIPDGAVVTVDGGEGLVRIET